MKSTIIFLSLLGLKNLVWVYAAESSSLLPMTVRNDAIRRLLMLTALSVVAGPFGSHVPWFYVRQRL